MPVLVTWLAGVSLLILSVFVHPEGRARAIALVGVLALVFASVVTMML